MSTDASVGGSSPTTVAARSDVASTPGGTRAAEIAAYLADVRGAMADLDPGVRDGLLDDLPEHLAEVAAADTEPLQSRLGSPATFAAELRWAAGLAPVSPAAADRPKDPSVSSAELAREFALQVDGTLGRLAGYDALRELLVALRPGWWVVHGAGVARSWQSRAYASYYMNLADVLGMALLAAIGALISVRLGQATIHASAGTRMLVAIIDVPCVLMVFYVALTIQRY